MKFVCLHGEKEVDSRSSFFLERIIILEKYRFIEIKAKYEI